MFRLQTERDGDAVQSELKAWIAASEMNARAWALAEKTWRITGSALPRFAHEWPERRTRPGPRRVSRARAAGMALVAMAASIAFVLFLPELRLRLTADHMTVTAESRQITLEDGSTVQLAPASAIATAFGGDRREVALLGGEAFFQVVSDPLRPFSVRAADMTVTVTGTAFDVGFTDRMLSVAVDSGAVEVVRRGQDGQRHFALGPGQSLAVDRRTGAIVEGRIATQLVAAWRSGRLIVDNGTLADAAEILGRYHSGAILIPDERLRESRVTGVFDLEDPVRALRVLSAPYGGVVRQITPYVVVLTDR